MLGGRIGIILIHYLILLCALIVILFPILPLGIGKLPVRAYSEAQTYERTRHDMPLNVFGFNLAGLFISSALATMGIYQLVIFNYEEKMSNQLKTFKDYLTDLYNEAKLDSKSGRLMQVYAIMTLLLWVLWVLDVVLALTIGFYHWNSDEYRNAPAAFTFAFEVFDGLASSCRTIGFMIIFYVTRKEEGGHRARLNGKYLPLNQRETKRLVSDAYNM